MNLEKVKKFIELAREEGVAELKYEEKDMKIAVNFNVSTSQVLAPQVMMPNAHQVAAGGSNESATPKSNFHEIKSPFVGTFYRAPSPDKPDFAKVGDKVSKGQTLCILEAMKIMNEIESDIAGEIVEICIDNESVVEYGEVLFRIKA